MTVRLRHPRVDAAGVQFGTPDRPSNNPPAPGRLCDRCRWASWCGYYRACWAEAEPVGPPRAKPVWTPELIVEAIRAHVRRCGSIPIADDWTRGTDDHPSSHRVQLVFGYWNDAIRAAGYKPTRSGDHLRKRRRL